MTDFKFYGTSRKSYTYMLVVPETKNVSRQPGNFIFAKGDAITPIPILVGKADNLREYLQELFLPGGLWDTARNVYEAKLLYIHVDQERDPAKRQTEQMDLEVAYRPVMNSSG